MYNMPYIDCGEHVVIIFQNPKFRHRNICCIQDTLSSRAALGRARPSASREQRYLAYKNI